MERGARQLHNRLWCREVQEAESLTVEWFARGSHESRPLQPSISSGDSLTKHSLHRLDEDKAGTCDSQVPMPRGRSPHCGVVVCCLRTEFVVTNEFGKGVLVVLDIPCEVRTVGGRSAVGFPIEVEHSMTPNHDAFRVTDTDGRVVGPELKCPQGGGVVCPWDGDVEGHGCILGHGLSVAEGCATIV